MRTDLLKAISKFNDITNVIICTFNIDLIFVETVLLRELKRCGHPSLTIFADAEEVTRTFNSQNQWLSNIGRRYRVVPVMMASGYRFHPKIVFLSSPKKAVIFVGSGNLTFGGFRQNDEIWTSFPTGNDGKIGPIAAFKEMVLKCAERSSASRGAYREINEAFDKVSREWANKLNEPDTLLWRAGQEASLLNQIASAVNDVPIDRILIGSPYYDENGIALREIMKQWPTASLDLLVQSGQSTLTQKALTGLNIQPKLHTVNSAYPEKKHAFIHAKFYALFSGEEVFFFSGSANCSVAALLSEGNKGNVEAMIFQRMNTEEFDKDVLSELQIIEEEPTIQYQPIQEKNDVLPISIRIVNASFENGLLSVTFKAREGVILDVYCVGENTFQLKPQFIADSTVTIPLAQSPRSIRLEGISSGIRVSSFEHWVDQEFQLSATSRQRKLAQSVEGNISPTSWSFESWTEIIRLVGDHLNYSPASSQQKSNFDKQSIKKTKVYSSDDFFTDDYRLPNHQPNNIFHHEDDRIIGLQRLLLDYFGVEVESDTGQMEQGDGNSEDVINQKNDEAVDRPEIISPNQKKLRHNKKRRNLNEAEKNRARKICTKLTNQLLEEHFLRHRHQDLLANDLTIISVLLIAGRSEGWLLPELFFELTYNVWTRLFFDCGLESKETAGKGWLQLRVEWNEDPKSFIDSVGSVPLSAALAIWSVLYPGVASEFEKKRFILATRMAVARVPWIWNLHRIDEVAQEIDRIASRTGWLKSDRGRGWVDIAKNWDRILGEGKALYRLEKSLLSRSIQEWRNTIDSGVLEAGTLLWQGHLGYAVTTQKTNCKISSVTVLLLRAEKREVNISSEYVLPIKFLLPSISHRGEVGNEDVKLLKRFIEEL